jgi:hypothetical protein
MIPALGRYVEPSNSVVEELSYSLYFSEENPSSPGPTNSSEMSQEQKDAI